MRILRLAGVFFPLIWLPHPSMAQTPGTASGSADGQSAQDLKQLSLDELLAVQVSSVTKQLVPLVQAPSAIQVITSDEIRRSGATTLPEALRLASNLHVARIDSRQWAISARGFNGSTANKLLVLIDGRVVYTPLYSGVFWDAQDVLLSDVERIEVISGPGATLWGSNAVNGVINVITKGAADTQGWRASASTGNELTHAVALRYGGTSGSSLSYRAYAKSFAQDHSFNLDGGSAGDDWHLRQGGFRSDWAGTTGSHLTLQGDWYAGRVAQLATGDASMSGGNLTGRWTRPLTDRSDLRVQIYYDRTDRTIPQALSENLDTYDLQLEHHVVLSERNDLLWGAGYRLIDDHVDNSENLAFLPPDVSRDWWTAFLQDEFALQERLHLTLGTKLEHNDYTGLEVQPSARFSLQVDENRTLWGAASRATRVPSRIDRELFLPADPPYLLAGNPDFSSEVLVAYEVGYRERLGESAAVSVAGFFDDYDDLRSTRRLNPDVPTPIILANGLRGRAWGGELSAEIWLRDDWRLMVGHTEQRIRLRPKPGSTISAQDTVTTDPERQFFLRSFADLGSGVSLDGSFRWVGGIESQSLPTYGELDARLSWQPVQMFEVALVGANLLHERHAEFGAQDSRHELRRAVYLSVVWHQ